ncbi:glycosyltransferase family 9 protein [uncultured Shewanella sp.]|uniref:glycosyltransferase family 9 protein n=1 Tax=uncultured Shewanella sp. TaxID=173975 RepID=UPI002638D86B|nr:glycosyltransferase family 9 protein [uncultured Shewanella sp.]
MLKLFNLLLKYQCFRRKKRSSIALSKPRILVIPYDAIGDMLLTLPVFSAIKKAHPDWDIEVLCHERSVKVLAQYPFVDRLWCWNINAKLFRNRYDQKKREELYTRSFTKIIYLAEKCNFRSLFRLQQFTTGKLLTLPYYSLKTDPKKRIEEAVFYSLFDGVVGKNHQQEPHFALRMFSSVSQGAEYVKEEMDFSPYIPVVELDYTFNSSKPAVLFNPAGTQPGNTLSEKKSAWIVNTLVKLGCQVFVFDLPSQTKLFIQENLKAQVTFMPSAHIYEGAQIIRMMDFIVTTDTSIGHLSSALLKPALILREDQIWRARCDPLAITTKVLVSDNPDDINTVDNDLIIQAIESLVFNAQKNHTNEQDIVGKCVL